MEQAMSALGSFVWVAFALAMAAVCWLYRDKVQVPRLVARRWVETKVRESGRISEEDIRVLASMNSPYLDDALALRFAQTERGQSHSAD